MLFKGLYTALITPFKDNKFDEQAFEKLIEFQIKGGVDGLVPCGTTGESPTLSEQEHNRVVKLCVEIVNKRVKVIAGAGSNSTEKTISLTNQAKIDGADAVLLSAPYYNKPTQEGLYQHYKKINECGIPIILYNVPGRSVVNISDETTARLSELPYIVGIKDATGDLERVATLRVKVPSDFVMLSGEDATAIGFNAMGGHGVISVTSNIMPKLCKELQEYSFNGDFKKALEIQDKLIDLHKALFSETSPAPVKFAASHLGLCENEIRLPLVKASKECEDRVLSVLKTLQLNTIF